MPISPNIKIKINSNNNGKKLTATKKQLNKDSVISYSSSSSFTKHEVVKHICPKTVKSIKCPIYSNFTEIRFETFIYDFCKFGAIPTNLKSNNSQKRQFFHTFCSV